MHKFVALVGCCVAGCLLILSPARANCYSTTGCYGALAAGIWQSNDGVYHAASGIAWNDFNQRVANVNAITRCQQAGNNCKLVGTFSNGGCGYVSLGTKGDSVKWGSGPSAGIAEANCREGGYACKAARGACAAHLR